MNAFPFTVHYDGNRPYHSICFALELSPVIYAPGVQIFYVTIQATFLSGRTQGGPQGAKYERSVYFVSLCGWVARHLWQCQCVTVAPLVREQRLERLPSRVAFVW